MILHLILTPETIFETGDILRNGGAQYKLMFHERGGHYVMKCGKGAYETSNNNIAGNGRA